MIVSQASNLAGAVSLALRDTGRQQPVETIDRVDGQPAVSAGGRRCYFPASRGVDDRTES
ncbi:MAG: hypothetical protein ABI624_06165 [Casimicrobiaceae bacterium]